MNRRRSLVRVVREQVRQRPALAILLLCLFLFLPGITSLPPLDRDESRYIQATKQMLETGDFIQIRFQDQARNKKPVGIYWLQAASAKAFAGPKMDRVWAYRLPSLVAGILTVMCVFYAARRLWSDRAALTAGALMAGSFLLIGEAHIAKTDAWLLLCVTVAQLALLELYLKREDALPNMAWAFWIAAGLGILIKGPVLAMICLLTIVGLVIADRDANWLKLLKPLRGIAIIALIVLPWGIAIGLQTGGAFYSDSVGKDFLPKLFSGMEQHGGLPGYYLMLVFATLWPASILLLPAGVQAFKDRKAPLMRFLLAWIVPAWIIFELVPTKLPHYVLPLYPAIVLIIVKLLEELTTGTIPALKRRILWPGLALWTLVAIVLAFAIALIPQEYGNVSTGKLLPFSLVLIGLAIYAAISMMRSRWQEGVLFATICGAMTAWLLLSVSLPSSQDLQLSPRLKAVVEAIEEGPVTIGSTGYAEPSLVFLFGTDTKLASADKVARALVSKEIDIALIEHSQREKFVQELLANDTVFENPASVTGYNYSKGDPLTIHIFRLAEN